METSDELMTSTAVLLMSKPREKFLHESFTVSKPYQGQAHELELETRNMND